MVRVVRTTCRSTWRRRRPRPQPRCSSASRSTSAVSYRPTATGSLAAATDAFDSAACGYSGAPNVAYRWSAPADGLYTFDTSSSDFDTFVAVRANCEAASQLACVNTSPSYTWDPHISLSLAAGQTVTIVVDGYGSANGTYSLSSPPQGNYRLAITGILATPTPTPRPTTTPTNTRVPIPTAPPLPTPASWLELSVIPGSGAAPLDVTFRYDFRSVHSIQSIAVDFEGDGADDFTTSDPHATLQNTYNTPGTYTPRLTVVDDQGTALSATAPIEVLDGVVMDALLTGIWEGMNAALLDGNVDEALSFLTPGAQQEYADVFSILLPDMAALIASYSPLQRGFVASEVAEYAVNRIIEGHNKIFLIYFIKGADGVWRLDAM